MKQVIKQTSLGIFVLAILLSTLLSTAVNAAPKWVQIPLWNSGENGPSDREHPLMFIRPDNPNQLILYGGMDFGSPQNLLNDLWSLNLKSGKWSRLKQTGTGPTATARAAVSEKTNNVLVTGGIAMDGSAANAAFTFSVEKNTGVWRKINSEILPRSLHSLVSLPDTNMFLSFGGISQIDGSKQSLNLTSILSLSGANSSKSNSAKLHEGLYELSEESPQVRYGFAYAYDRRNQRLIIANGQGPMGISESGELINSQDEMTYSLQLTGEQEGKWIKHEKSRLAPRRNACWAHDTKRNHVYVWGGTADGATSVQGLSRLDLNETVLKWKEIESTKPASGVPEPRSSCVGVYDESRDRILFGFGNNLNSEMTAIRPMTDIWSLQL